MEIASAVALAIAEELIFLLQFWKACGLSNTAFSRQGPRWRAAFCWSSASAGLSLPGENVFGAARRLFKTAFSRQESQRHIAFSGCLYLPVRDFSMKKTKTVDAKSEKDAVFRYDPSGEKAIQKSPQAFLNCELK